MSLLRVRDLSVTFGGSRVLDAVNLEVNSGEVVGLIGPNGAGKTTLINAVSGFVEPEAGDIALDGRQIAFLPPHERARLGLARTFQTVRLFRNLSVLENLMVAAEASDWHGPLSDGLRLPYVSRAEHRTTVRAEAVLEEVGMAAHAGARAGELPLGMQRRVEIGRALCLEPRILLLDEATSGIGREDSTELVGFIRELSARRNLAMLLIEHDVRVVMGASDWVYVLDFGRLLAQGPPGVVSNDEAVMNAYLGETDAVSAAVD